MAEDNKTLTEVQIAQAAVNTPPAQQDTPVPGAPAPAPVVATTPDAPQGNEGTRGLVDPNAPQEQATPPVDPNAVAAAPEDGFDPDAIAAAAGGAAAGGGGGGGSANFNIYDPGAMGGGRGALDLLGNLDLTTSPLTGLTGVQAGNPDDGVTGRPTSDFLTLGNSEGYENLTPNANLGNYSEQPLQLNITFNPLNGSSLASITLTLPDGVGLLIGGPNVAPVYGTVTLTPAQLANLYLLPVAYSDADFTITAVATVTDRLGGTQVLAPITLDVVIDAVAQRPEDVANELVDDGTSSHSMSEITSQNTTIAGGLERTNYTVTAGENEGRVNVALSVSATFKDFDGSEQHYMLIEQLPGFTGTYPTVVLNGITYFQIPVDNATLAANGGSATITVNLQAPQTSADTNFSVQTGAMAVETPTDGELRTDNNVSVVFDQNRVDFTIDTINSTLTVEAGWASEGGNDAKHIGGSPAEYTYDGVEANATSDNGAPVRIALDGGQGSTEVIDSVTFTYDGSRGALEYTGPGTVTQSTAPDGTVTFTITGVNSDSLTGLSFKPVTTGPQSFNDADVSLNYTVNVINGAGASATFSGSSTVAIDAVADRSTTVTSNIDDETTVVDTTPQGTVTTGGIDAAAHDATSGWETDTYSNTYTGTGYSLSVNVATSFPDTDGSEKHYILVEQPTGWSLGTLPAGYTDAGSYTGSDGKTYFKIEVPASAQGTVNVNIPLQTDTVTGDMNSVTVKTGSLAEEQAARGAADREYDTANNTAERLDGTAVTYSVDVINSTLTVQTGWASEGNNDAKALGQASTGYDYAGTQAGSTSTNVDQSNNGAPVNLSIAGGQGSTEVIDSVTFTYDGSRGALEYTGPGTVTQSTAPNGTVTYTITGVNSADLGGKLLFVPTSTGPQSYNDDDVKLDYTVTVKNDAGASVTFNGSSTVIIDAVADRSTTVTSNIDGETTVVDTTPQGTVTTGGTDAAAHDATSGWETDTYSNTYTGTGYSLSVNVATSFPDTDGSEKHYILVEHPAGWSLGTLPAGYTDAGSYTGSDGKTYFKIEVPPSAQGTVNVTIPLQTDMVTGDMNSVTVKTGSLAEEQVTSGAANSEYDTANNTAERLDGTAVTYSVDVINSTLTIQTGWASEGNNDAKSLGQASTGYDYAGTQAGSTGTNVDQSNNGAPINLSIGGGQGSTEVIDSVTFTYDSSRGALEYTGPGTVTQSTAPNGTVTYTITGVNSADLGGKLLFVPTSTGPQSYNDDDVKLDYTVTVKNDAGASVTFNGSSTVIIDAVADRSTTVTSNIDGETTVVDTTPQGTVTTGGTDAAAHDATSGWETDTYSNTYTGTGYSLSVNVATSFPDTDGSEKHYILVEQPTGWSLGTLPAGYTDAGSYTGSDGKTYFKIEVSDSTQGTVNVNIPLQTDTVTGDMNSVTVKTGSLAEEQVTSGAANSEYDTANNTAERLDGTAVTYSVDVINSTLTIQTGWASEGNNDAKSLGQASTGYDYAGTQAGSTGTNVDQSNNGAPINLSIGGGQGSTEVIDSVTFTYDSSRGALEYTGPGTVTQSTAPNGTVTFTITGVNSADLGGKLLFVPSNTGSQSYNDDDVKLDYTVTVKNDAGASVTFNGSSTVIIDAVADQGTMGAGSVDYADPNHTAAEAGEVVKVNGSVSFPDTDGSELHYAVIAIPDAAWSIAGLAHDQLLSKDAINAFWRDQGGMPANGTNAAVDAALNGILTSGNASSTNNQYLLIEVDPSTGNVAVYARDVGGNMVEVNIPGLQVSYTNGTLTYTVPVQTPVNVAQDASMDVSSQGVALEKAPSDGEYDYANNIAVTSDTETVHVVVDVITGRLNVSLSMHEDASPNQNQVVAGGDPATGAKDTVTHDAGYGPDGMPISMSLDGASVSEYVKTITVGTLPDTAQGVIYYNGVAVTAGQIINNPDLTKFTFKPAENFSGDVNFNFSTVIASNTTGATLPAQNLSVPLHVDSVADLADASSSASGRTEAGNEVLTADDAKFEQGWAKQEVSEAGHSIDVTFTVNATFGDLDGSEKAWIDIELPAGYSIPTGSSYQLVTVGGVNYARIAVALPGDVDANGNYTKDITLNMDDTATDKNLSIKVVTQEQDSLNSDGHSTANNTAERVIEQAVAVDHLDGLLKVNVGWVYEDNNGGKFGGTAAGPDASFDTAAGPSAGGAPINISFTPAGTEQLQFVEFTYDPAKGTLYYNGAAIDTSGTMPIKVAANQLGKLTFKPAEGYSDSDIKLDYKVTIKDGGTTFVVNGSTSVVVDAVADKADVSNREIDYAGNQTAHTGAAGETIDMVVKATFKDTGDGSEKHYILVENPGAGWSCAGSTTITVYCDANGKPLQPNGIDVNGNFTYASTANPKQYFQIDVTGNYSANGEYRVTLTPPAYTQDTTVTIKTGTLVEETTVSSDANREYDYSNNQAYDLGSTSIKFNPVDGTISSALTVAYEDHMPDAHTGNMTNPGTDGRITLNITSGQETVNAAAADAVVLTFKCEGTPGTFTFNGVNYTATSLGNNEWKLTLPGSAVGANQTQVQVRYNPPANDDTDLTNITFDVKVVATGSGATGTLSGSAGTLVVDAVADKPTDVKSSTNDAMDSFKPGDVANYVDPTISKNTQKSSWSASTGLDTAVYEPTYAAKSFQFTIKAEAAFADVDGSETHYLLVQRLSTSWSVDQTSLPAGVTLVGTVRLDSNGNVVATGGTEYFKFQVNDSLLDANGKIAADIKLNTPNISGDQSYTIKTGGLAVEENVSDSEARTDNNTAVTIGTGTTVTVDAVQSTLTVKTGWAPEDNNAAQHLPDGSSYNSTTGSLGSGYASVPANYGFGTDKAALVNLSLSQSAQDHFTKIVFTFDASSGEFIYNQNSTAYSVVVQTVNGQTTVTVTYNANAAGNYTVGSDNFYFRPSGNNSDADVKLDYQVTVEGRDDNQITYQGSSPITVDAVADRPTDLELDTTGDYLDGAVQTAAKPGEDVKLTVENVQFHDYKDGSEQHYIVINKNLTGTAGTNIATLDIPEQTIVVKGTGPNGELFTQTVVIGTNAASSSITISGPGGVISTRPMTATEFNGVSSVDGYSNFKIPVLNEFLQLTADGNVSTSVNVTAPNADADTHYNATVGGYAQETNTNSNANHEVDPNNNNSLNTGTVGFDVKPVTSVPEITIDFGDSKIYENLTPNANQGNYTESQGAKIQVGGIDVGETATITLTFESKSGVDFTSTDPADVMRVEYNGDSYPVTQGPDGKWTVTIEVEGSAANIDGELIFKPGHNYNSSDIKVDYDVIVTDNSSGHEKTWNNTTPGSEGYQDNNLGILVDAVAQIPVLGGLDADYSATGGSGAFVRGDDIVLRTSVTFQDFEDGSEKHFLLVEAKPGWEAPNKIVIVDGNGVSHEVPVTYTMQFYNGDMYYRMEIPNSYIQQYGVDGKLDVQVWIDSPADATNTSFKVGAVAWEDVTHADLEIRSDNNTAFVISDPVPVAFDQVGSLTLHPQGGVYENDTKNAHKDDPAQPGVQPDETPSGGTHIAINHNAGDTVSNFNFTNYDTSKGTLLYGNAANGYTAINPNGNVGTLIPGNDFIFIPAHNYSDADINLNFSATVTNTNSGDTKTINSSAAIVVDAVAQMPTDVGTTDQTIDAVYEGGKTTITIPVTAKFYDFTDGSEEHYVLVEAKANMSVPGNAGTFSMYDATTNSYTTYYKILVDNDDILAGGGTVTVNVEIEVGRLGVDAPNSIKVGALAVEPVENIDDGEITYHNNTAFTDGGSVTVNYDGGSHPGTHDHVWVDFVYENNTPNAHLGDNTPEYGKIHLENAPSNAGSVTITPPTGVILVHQNGTAYTANPNGSYTIPKEAFGDVYIKIPQDYSDKDFLAGNNLEYTFYGPGETHFDVSMAADINNPSSMILYFPAGTIDIQLPAGVENRGWETLKDGVTKVLHLYKGGTERWEDYLPQIKLTDLNPNDGFALSDVKYAFPSGSVSNSHLQDMVYVTVTTTTSTVVVESGTTDIVVDAVAQKPVGLTTAVDYTDQDGIGHTAMGAHDGEGNNGTATIRISGTFADNDGSEKHYALVEHQPGFNVVGATTVYIDGKSYYQVEMARGSDGKYLTDANGKQYANVTLTVSDPTKIHPDGHDLATGVMTVEGNSGVPGNQEATLDNNISWTLNGNAHIDVSLVESTVSVTIGNTYEDQAIPITISGSLVGNDSFNGLTLSHSGNGTIIVTDPNNVGGWTITADGKLVITNFDAIGKITVSFTPESHSDTDVTWNWSGSFTDSASGDVLSVSGNPVMVVDAVAQKPVITDHEFSSVDGHEAAVSGGKAIASTEITFADRDGSETHYAVLEQDGIWKCDKVEINGQSYNVITVFSADGTPYYAVEITNAMLAISDPVKVNFILDAPNSTSDTSSTLNIGGIAIETTTGAHGDKELTLSNNWAENLESVDVKIGVVGTTDLGLTVNGLTEDDADGAAITLNTAQLAANNEKVNDVTLTFEGDFGSAHTGDVVGTIIYDGKAYAVTLSASGTATAAIDFGPNGYDAGKDFRVVWGTVQTDGSGNVVWENGIAGGTPVVTDFNHTGGNMTVTSDATVVDKASGVEKSVTSDSDITFTPAADAPTNIDVTDPSNAVGSSASVTFSVSASFVDVDGSEQHFILVQKQAGWSGSYSVTNIGGVDYFKIPVSSTDPNPSVNITLKTPSGITTDQTVNLVVGGMAVDGSDTKTTFEGDSVAIDIGVVNATGVALSMPTMAEDGYTQMNFSLTGGNNDVITGLKFTNLNGGSIVDSTGAPVSLSSPLTPAQVAHALAGDYYFKPAANVSGNVSVGFEATVKDDASGVSKTFSGQTGAVVITPVTDTPEDADSSVTGPTNQVGHVASVNITLSADFIDYTGSESHFFLVKLPAGAIPPSGWIAVTDAGLLSASGMSGTVYKVAANPSGTGSFTITVPEHFASGDVIFAAGSSEMALNPPVYQFSSQETATIGSTGTINFGPDAQNASGTLTDALRHPDVPVTGHITMTDADGDTVTVATLHHNGTDATVDGQNLVVDGTYGTLTINTVTGAYTYELHTGVTPPHGSMENFNLTVSDGHGGTDSSTLAITVNAPNADPTAANQSGSTGGVNENVLAPLHGTFLMSDSDGDTVTIGGVSYNGTNAAWNDATQHFELAGQYGMLSIDKSGTYTYTLTNEHAHGQENFVVSFGDQYGGAGNSTLTVNVDYINHAPVAQGEEVTFPEGYHFMTGSVAFSDVDTGYQGDTPLVTKVTVGHDTYNVAETGWTEVPGEHGVLKVMSDGSYMYTPNDPSTATTLDTWDSFSFTVTDHGGLSDTANLDIALGNPPPAFSGFSAASINLDEVFDAVGAEAYHGKDAATTDTHVSTIIGADSHTDLGALPDLPPIDEEHKVDTM